MEPEDERGQPEHHEPTAPRILGGAQSDPDHQTRTARGQHAAQSFKIVDHRSTDVKRSRFRPGARRGDDRNLRSFGILFPTAPLALFGCIHLVDAI